MHELAVPRHRHDGAGHALGGDLAGEETVEPRKALLREADIIGVGFGQRRGARCTERDDGSRAAIMAIVLFIVSSQARARYAVARSMR